MGLPACITRGWLPFRDLRLVGSSGTSCHLRWSAPAIYPVGLPSPSVRGWLQLCFMWSADHWQLCMVLQGHLAGCMREVLIIIDPSIECLHVRYLLFILGVVETPEPRMADVLDLRLIGSSGSRSGATWLGAHMSSYCTKHPSLGWPKFWICGSWQLWCLGATWLGAHISSLIGCIVRNLLCVGLFACARA